VNDLSYNPIADFPVQITDSCNGVVQFTGPVIFGPGTQYDWDFGDGNTSTLANPVHTYTPADQFYTIKVKVRPPGSCGFIESSKQILPRGLNTTVDYDYTAVCDSDYVRFTSHVNVYPDTAAIQLLWDFGDGNTSTLPNPIHTFSPGSYTVKLQIKTTTGCLDNSSTQNINVGKLDIQVTPPFQEIDAGQSVQLTVSGGATSFVWTPPAGLSDTHIPNPVAKPTKNTWYKVTGTNDAGCTDKDSMFIKIRPVPGIYVPTAFTPNNDGMNDVFKPIIGGADFKLKEFTIYNRWGQKVFSTTTDGEGWDGRIHGLLQSSGTYIWIVTATEKNTIVHKKKGTFMLIR
jgi:gliding motility-associated-like protein